MISSIQPWEPLKMLSASNIEMGGLIESGNSPTFFESKYPILPFIRDRQVSPLGFMKMSLQLHNMNIAWNPLPTSKVDRMQAHLIWKWLLWNPLSPFTKAYLRVGAY